MAKYKRKDTQELPVFEMPFQPETIDHLGLRLYSTLPPVISELVSNAYDAESPKVEVILPIGKITKESEVVVRDFGHSMDPKEIQNEYLPIGRNRRDASSSRESKSGKVKVTGRKGLGKLSAFGVAEEMDIRSIKSGYAVCLRINYKKLKEWGKKHPKVNFQPEVVKERTGTTSENDGVELRLRRLHRERAISEDLVRRGLARRLLFIGRQFDVFINGKPIQAGDRVNKGDCAPGYTWDVKKIPGGGEVSKDLKVSGWIGFSKKSSQADRGVDIFASNKAVELGSYFNLASTHAQFARAHLVGEIHAEFLDADEDLAATARNSVVWESGSGQLFQDWGQETLKWAFKQWVKKRKDDRSQKVYAADGFSDWLNGRTKQEKKVADRLIGVLVKDDDMEPESITPLLDIVKSSIETIAFRELLEVLEEGNAASILQLFGEWRILEAREHLKLADGRLSVIDKLEQFIIKGALEVQELQPLFRENLWIFDPGWNEAYIEKSYTKLLQDLAKEPRETPEKNRRLDIFGVSDRLMATVVELKRPKKKVSRGDLNQIEEYVDWTRNNLKGTGPDAPKYINGLLVVGELNNKGDLKDKLERLAGNDIRVETLGDLCRRWRGFYGVVEQKLKVIAPEYTRTSRKATSKN